jgi:hypothetical protein
MFIKDDNQCVLLFLISPEIFYVFIIHSKMKKILFFDVKCNENKEREKYVFHGKMMEWLVRVKNKSF